MMSSNDDSEIAGAHPTSSEADNPSNDVHQLGLLPGSNAKTTHVTFVNGGRGGPLSHPDPFGDDDEYEPIDPHSLNVDPGQPAFSFIAQFYDAGESHALPHPDPLEGREESDDCS